MLKLIYNLISETIKKITPCNHEYELEGYFRNKEYFRNNETFESYNINVYKCKKCLKTKKIRFKS